MKANELRIGNYVNYNGKDCVFGIYDIVNLHDDEDCANLTNPIPLTEEWLLKFGFGRGEMDCEFIFRDSDSMIDESLIYYTDIGVLIIDTDRDEIEINHVKYVHQLQNLYFALTNNELTL